MKSFFVPTLALAAALFAGLGQAAQPAHAENPDANPPITWSVSPSDAQGKIDTSWLELDADPGSGIIKYVAIRNLGEAPVQFQLTAADGYFTDSGRFNMLPAERASTESGTWITIQPTVDVLQGQTAVVPVKIVVPENAAPGDHAAGVAASIRTSGVTAEGAYMGVVSRMGFRVITRVSGEIRAELSVERADVQYSPSWNPFRKGTVALTYTVGNTGNVLLSHTDQVDGGAPTEWGGLLPGEARAVTSEAHVWPLFLVPLVLQVTPSGTGPELTADAVVLPIHVWAIPWSQLIVAAGTGLLIFSLVSGRRRGRIRVRQMVDAAREQGRLEAGP